MPTVAISVDCEAANIGKCYTRELVRVAEEFTVPLTWLIFASEKDPLSNIDLYYNEYFHRIPSWHEIGLLLCFENSKGYITDQKERGALVYTAKDAIKSRHIKPNSVRVCRSDLLAGDLKWLEEYEFLVDGSLCPGAMDKDRVVQPDAPAQPYHPSYDDVRKPGDAKILLAPVATLQGVCGNLDQGWNTVKKVVEHSLTSSEYTHLVLSDHVDNAATLRQTLALCKEKGARFVTLTQTATL